MKIRTKRILPLALVFAALPLYLSGVPQAQAGSFLTNSPMITGHFHHTATLLRDGKVLVVGGDDPDPAELFDPATGKWAVTGAMNHLCDQHTATLLPDGKVLVVSGDDSDPAELYDPATGKWAVTGDPTNGSYSAAATLLPNGKVLVAWDALNAGSPRIAGIYDPATGTWRPTNPMKTPFSSLTVTLMRNGQVLLAGGLNKPDDDPSSYFSYAEIYNPGSGSWTTVTNTMRTGMDWSEGSTATSLLNGKVLLVGWRNIRGAATSTQIYDPARGTLTEACEMAEPRRGHTATLLPDGKVFVVGGLSILQGTVLSSAELYDPASGRWTQIVNHLATERFSHTATLLPNGKVLIAGGLNGTNLSSTELYDPGETSPVR